jgi:hypothetical protein
MPTTFSPMRFMTGLLIAVMLVSTAGTTLAARKRGDLDRNQYAFSAAIRWGDFEGAWMMVDPKIRKEKPMTDVDFSRYEQIQVTGYRDLASMPGPDGTLLREIQIEVVNRNTLSQRRVRFTEAWRYDAQAKTWWISGLPDFWQGK